MSRSKLERLLATSDTNGADFSNMCHLLALLRSRSPPRRSVATTPIRLSRIRCLSNPTIHSSLIALIELLFSKVSANAIERSGSNCQPAQRTISCTASRGERALEYGRFVHIASKLSAILMIRETSGMSLPPSRDGYP